MGTGDIHVLEPGMVLNNRYTLRRAIGEGGFGITYEGYDELLAMRVCIKEYYPQGFVTRDIRYNKTLTVTQTKFGDIFYKGKVHFLEEARTLARFSHEEGIVRVTDFFEMNNTAYIVMEYLDGINLKQYLEQNGPFSVNELLELLEPVMHSLEEIHRAGLIHRDISPDNIMILLNGKNGKVKLMDFGAARDYTEYGQQSMSVVLKHGYAPVEQYQSHGVQGPWTDIYALSATIYKCITGQTPVESIQRTMGDTLMPPSRMGVNINPAVEQALLKGLYIDQRGRYNNMADFYQDLYHPDPSADRTVPYTDDRTVPGYPPYTPPAPPNPPEPPRTNKAIIALVAVFACLTIVIVVILGVTLTRSGSGTASSGGGAAQVASQSESASVEEDSEENVAAIQGSADAATTEAATTEEESTTEEADVHSDTLAYLDNDSINISACLDTSSYALVTSADGAFSFRYPMYTFNHSYVDEESGYYELSYVDPDTGNIGMRLIVYESDNSGDALENALALLNKRKAEASQNGDKQYYEWSSSEADSTGTARGILGLSYSGAGNMNSLYTILANNGSKDLILEIYYQDPDPTYDLDSVNYVVDCVYRYCSFGGTTYKPRSYELFMQSDMGEKK
ncbi:MAG: serine/threonine protein kinase [Clostridiales bacterium]|nr:serine/threonine protein kinase [Clostridiales bacterium]